MRWPLKRWWVGLLKKTDCFCHVYGKAFFCYQERYRISDFIEFWSTWSDEFCQVLGIFAAIFFWNVSKSPLTTEFAGEIRSWQTSAAWLFYVWLHGLKYLVTKGVLTSVENSRCHISMFLLVEFSEKNQTWYLNLRWYGQLLQYHTLNSIWL